MKKILTLILLSLLLFSCGQRELSIEETKDVYKRVYELYDTIGNTTVVTKNEEHLVIKEDAKTLLKDIESLNINKEIKGLMIETCNKIIDNCNLQIDKGWEESSKDFENVTKTFDELEKQIEEFK